jgi:hypothetical protein
MLLNNQIYGNPSTFCVVWALYKIVAKELILKPIAAVAKNSY